LLTFRDAATFDSWLTDQPEDAGGAWLRFAKKGAPEQTISKSDAIDCALAHGWVDGQLGRVDGCYFKTRFTPRKPKSAWSQVNCQTRRSASDRRTHAAQRPSPNRLGESRRALGGRLCSPIAGLARWRLGSRPGCRTVRPRALRHVGFSQSVLRALSRASSQNAGEARREDRWDGRQARPWRNLSPPARQTP
jgi:hypothetical protein